MIILFFFMKTYDVDAHKNDLAEDPQLKCVS